MCSPPLLVTKVDDVYLMESFASHGYKSARLSTLNICQKYLQVLTLGDITTPDRSTILPPIKAGQRPISSTSSLVWPTQPSPDPKSWRLWRSALRNTFETRGSVKPSLRTTAWSRDSHRIFHWYYKPSTNSLFHSFPADKWQLYRQVIHRGRQPVYRTYYQTPTIINNLPPGATPATVLSTAPHLVQLQSSCPLHTPPPLPLQKTLQRHVQHTLPTFAWVLQDTHGLEHLEHISKMLYNRETVH